MSKRIMKNCRWIAKAKGLGALRRKSKEVISNGAEENVSNWGGSLKEDREVNLELNENVGE